MSDPSVPGGSSDRPALGLLAGLTALNTLSFVDRQLVVTLAPLLMEDLGLSRAQIGLLVGASFIVVFAGLTLVMGAAADRFDRPRLIAGGLLVWSLATAATGAAGGFATLLLLRACVGVGEAVLSPTAISMLSDRFPPARLGFATSVFYSGIPLGFAISFGLAGFFGPWLGWRACFVMLGGAGVLAVASVMRMQDPGRRRTGAPASAGPGEHARQLARTIGERPVVLLVSVAAALLAFASSASQHTITWLVEERGFDYSRAALLSGAFVAGGGLLGTVLIGAVSDQGRRLHPAGRPLTIAGMAALAFPVAAAFYLMPPDSPLFLPAWFLTQAWMLGWFGALMAVVAEATPAGARGGVLGFSLLFLNLFGVAVGPWVAGVIGDREGLTTGLLVTTGVGALGIAPLLAAAWLLGRSAGPSVPGEAA